MNRIRLSSLLSLCLGLQGFNVLAAPFFFEQVDSSFVTLKSSVDFQEYKTQLNDVFSEVQSSLDSLQAARIAHILEKFFKDQSLSDCRVSYEISDKVKFTVISDYQKPLLQIKDFDVLKQKISKAVNLTIADEYDPNGLPDIYTESINADAKNSETSEEQKKAQIEKYRALGGLNNSGDKEGYSVLKTSNSNDNDTASSFNVDNGADAFIGNIDDSAENIDLNFKNESPENKIPERLHSDDLNFRQSVLSDLAEQENMKFSSAEFLEIAKQAQIEAKAIDSRSIEELRLNDNSFDTEEGAILSDHELQAKIAAGIVRGFGTYASDYLKLTTESEKKAWLLAHTRDYDLSFKKVLKIDDQNTTIEDDSNDENEEIEVIDLTLEDNLIKNNNISVTNTVESKSDENKDFQDRTVVLKEFSDGSYVKAHTHKIDSADEKTADENLNVSIESENHIDNLK